jgi:GNAT superfamily N-acetyltransferase
MAHNELAIRSPKLTDLADIANLLTAEGFGGDSGDRLRGCFDQIHAFSFVAVRTNQIQGVLLATFNGWHVFASHLAVAPPARGQSVGKILIKALLQRAARAGAKGLIVDARLSAVGFFQKLDFRLPGAVFLIKDVQPTRFPPQE